MVFRDDKYQEILHGSFTQSVELGHYEIAQKIHIKYGDLLIKISDEPYFETYLERYFVTCRQIENFKSVKTKKERKQQTIKLENKVVYQNFLCNLLKSKKPGDQSLLLNLEEDFECPVCFDYMCRPLQIFSCHNGHFICSICMSNPKIKFCPICRDDFNKWKPKRCHQAEKAVKNSQETRL